MFKDSESLAFIEKLGKEVQAEVTKNRLAVQSAVGVVQSRNERGRIEALGNNISASLQWAQERAEIGHIGERIQSVRDSELSRINADQARKRAKAYARNKESGNY